MSIKQKTLAFLEQHRGKTISGADLANRLGVTRNAIWKSIQLLKREGYAISSSQGNGYIFESSNNILSAEGVFAHLKMPLSEGSLFYYGSLSSTNRKAKELVNRSNHESPVVLANYQSAGQGRLGRSFFSPKGKGLYLSIVLRPQLSAQDALSLTTTCAVAVTQVLEEKINLSPQIKWINDIYIDNKKVCGILTQAVTNMETGIIEYVILGIGLNVSTLKNEFPEELQDTATSIFPDGKTTISRNELAAALIDKIYILCLNPDIKAIMPYYKSHSLVLHKHVAVFHQGQEMQGYILDILDNGALKIEYECGKNEVLQSGEISIRIKESKQ